MKKTIFFITTVLLIMSSCKDKVEKQNNEERKTQVEQVTTKSPLVAPINPFAAKGVYPMPHGDPAQQDASDLAGPLDTSRKLNPDEIQYVFTGPASIGAYTTQYENGKNVL